MILRQLHVVITTHTGWDPGIATHGAVHRKAAAIAARSSAVTEQAVGASPTRH
ncbi:MAG: hypothetical protein ACRDWI_06055 [Jiangellaceae bacterium]